MAHLLTIPNELLDEIASYLDALATSRLLLSCRQLAFVLTPAMHQHAEAPKDGQPALHWAAARGHLPLLAHLLTRFPVDLAHTDHRTPLHVACFAGLSTATVDLLLQHGAAINTPNALGLSALCYAASSPHRDDPTVAAILHLLLSRGADVHAAPHPPLGIAVACGFVPRARILLAAGASPDTRLASGEPVLVTAARHGSTGLLPLLLSHGASTSAANNHGSTALLIASQYGPVDAVRLLVAHGVDLRCRDRDGDSPLLVAIMGGQPDVAVYLLEVEGVDVDTVNAVGQEPYSQAMSRGYDDVVAALEGRGVGGWGWGDIV